MTVPFNIKCLCTFLTHGILYCNDTLSWTPAHGSDIVVFIRVEHTRKMTHVRQNWIESNTKQRRLCVTWQTALIRLPVASRSVTSNRLCHPNDKRFIELYFKHGWKDVTNSENGRATGTETGNRLEYTLFDPDEYRTLI